MVLRAETGTLKQSSAIGTIHYYSLVYRCVTVPSTLLDILVPVFITFTNVAFTRN